MKQQTSKRFNITGLCNPDRHWMADVSGKITGIMAMVEAGDYFIINRPRQYGKTTTLFLLEKALLESGQFLPVKISFEGIHAPAFQNYQLFIDTFIDMIKSELEILPNRELVAIIEQEAAGVNGFLQLDKLLDKLNRVHPHLVLMIDEVDNASNNQLFLDFLGMLRRKYLKKNEGKGHTFQSVILAGVHDVKTLKAKIRPDDDQKLNSPWNIAAPFDMDMGLNVTEISSLLYTYAEDKGVSINITEAAEKLYYYTSGYPFLVSYICKLLDEKILPSKPKESSVLTQADIEIAVNQLLKESNTNFDSLIKNLENNPELYQFIKSIAVEGELIPYYLPEKLILLGKTYGILGEKRGNCEVHNRIYEQLMHDRAIW